MSDMLQLDQVGKRFGGVVALEGISASIQRGELVGLIGPNGAGKTTFFNLITGFQPATSGTIVLAGRLITHLPAHAIANLGVARTFQTSRIFPELTVIENVRIGAGRYAPFWRSMVRTGTVDRQREAEALALVGLEGLAHQRAGALPHGYRRLLEAARLFVRRPELVLLDEPAAGLNDQETVYLTALIRRLRQEGCTVILVEHNLDFVMSLAERLLVLNYGELIFDGTPHAATRDQRVLDAYLGLD